MRKKEINCGDNSSLFLRRSVPIAKSAIESNSPFEDKMIMIHPMHKDERILLEGKANQDRKRIMEWIEMSDPHGIELLQRISQSQTPYKKLIISALQEFYEYIANKKHKEERIYNDLSRKSNSVNREMEIIQRKNYDLLKENENIRAEMKRMSSKIKEIECKIKRYIALIGRDRRKHDLILYKGVEFNDYKTMSLKHRINLYSQERVRLENLLDEKEKRLFDVTREHKDAISGGYMSSEDNGDDKSLFKHGESVDK